MAITSNIANSALRIGQGLVQSAKTFRNGVVSGAKNTNQRINRTAEFIKGKNKVVVQENKKQTRARTRNEENRKRNEKEKQIESKNVVKPMKKVVDNLLVKPLFSLSTLITAWLIDNIPVIIREIRKFVKKVKILGYTIKNTVRAVGGTFSSMLKITKAFIKNISEFDFSDKSGRIATAKIELDANLEEINTNINEISNVWNREENELDDILTELEKDSTTKDAIDMIITPQIMEAGINVPVEPQTTAVGAGSQTGSDNVRALLDTISFAEGTPSYGTIYGGAVVPELAAGELTIGEVLKMQKTGKVRGRSAGYKRDGYNSDATGRYQFMSYVLEEEMRIQRISKDTKFTPALQDQMILARIARMRGVTQDKVNKEGLSADVIDRLAPEFASFPNLKGPDAKGRTGTNTSYYGQGGKSQAALVDYFGKAQKSNKSKTQTQMPSVPDGQSTGQLVSKVPYSQFSKSAAQGGTGSVGLTDGYLARGGSHRGVDIGTSGGKGWYVSLKVNGKVTYVGAPDGLHRGAGKMIIIADAKEPSREYVFMHMERILLRSGETYKAGTPIGEIGNTGGSRGEHLHYEVRINNRHIDPMPYLKLIEIGKLKMTQKSSSQNLSSNSKENANNSTQTIASTRTGTGRTRTNVVVMKEKEVVMVG